MNFARGARVAVPHFLAACANTRHSPRPRSRQHKNPPADHNLYLKALAEGVQINECGQKTDASYEWSFKASLKSRSGVVLGTLANPKAKVDSKVETEAGAKAELALLRERKPAGK